MVFGGVAIGEIGYASESAGDPVLTFQTNTSRTLARYDESTEIWSTITWPASVGGVATPISYPFVMAARRNPNMIWMHSYSARATAPILYTDDGGANWQNIVGPADMLVGNGDSFIFGGIGGPEGNSVYIPVCCDLGSNIYTWNQRRNAVGIWRWQTGTWTRMAYPDQGYGESPDASAGSDDNNDPLGLFGQGIQNIGFTPTGIFYMCIKGQYNNDNGIDPMTLLTVQDMHFVDRTDPDGKTHINGFVNYPWGAWCYGAPDEERGWVYGGIDEFDYVPGATPVDDSPPASLVRVRNGVAESKSPPDPVTPAYGWHGGLLDLGGGVVLVWGSSTDSASTSLGTLFRSTDYGDTWTSVSPFIASTTYRFMGCLENGMVADPVDWNVAWLTCYNNTTRYLFKTVDQGLTWTLVPGLPSNIEFDDSPISVSRSVIME